MAELILSGDTVSWDELRAVCGGRLSPRTFGFILRDLESLGATIMKVRDPEYGTLYRYDSSVGFDDRYRLSKDDGNDAINNPYETTGERAPRPAPKSQQSAAPTESLEANSAVEPVVTGAASEPPEVEALPLPPQPSVVPPSLEEEGVSLNFFFDLDEDGLPIVDLAALDGD